MAIPLAFIKKIPKTDLHLHLDGSLRIKTLIELAIKDGVELPSYTEAGLRKTIFKKQYKDLVEYLQGFYYTVRVLQSYENIERVSYELAQDNIKEGVRYIEVRFAPQLHTSGGLTAADSFRAVCAGLNRAKKGFNKRLPPEEPEFNFAVIAIAHRNIDRKMSSYYRSLIECFPDTEEKEISVMAALELAKTAVKLVKKEGLPITGFDVAGQEAGYPAENYKKAFQYAHENFIRKTVHAGEAYGPESIFQAITECHANRIGHGTFLFAADMIKDKSVTDRAKYVRDLADYIASERIGVEVCLTSNLQTNPAIKDIKRHPVHEMIKNGIPVSICTDNRLISDTTVCNELKLLADNFKLTQAELRNVVIAGFKGSFFPGGYNERRKYIRNMTRRYLALEKDFFK